MTDRELMQMALDALNVWELMQPHTTACAVRIPAIEALRAQLEHPEQVIQARKEGDLIVVDMPKVPTGSGGIYRDEQSEPEPVAWMHDQKIGFNVPLYTEPPKKEWIGLTDEELEFYTEELGQGELGRGVLRAVVDFLKEKNI